MRDSFRTAATVLLACLPFSAAAQGLPGGATSLSEKHGEWLVSCVSAETEARCAVSYTQLSNDAQRTRVLAIELAGADESGTTTGILVLPFGLKLDDGVFLAVDDEEPVSARFSTCLPVGCLVPLTLDASRVAAMAQGTSLAVTATISDGGQPASFSAPLTGLASALDRLKQIKGQ